MPGSEQPEAEHGRTQPELQLPLGFSCQEILKRK